MTAARQAVVTMNIDVGLARRENAVRWLHECGYACGAHERERRYYVNSLERPPKGVVIPVSGHDVLWNPADEVWLVVEDGEYATGRQYRLFCGTQPEFAVFVRQLREGKIELK